MQSQNSRDIWQIVKINTPSEIVQFITDVFQIMEIRARVGQLNGIVFEIRTKERNHTKPHVHASYGEYNISILIEDGSVLSGNLPLKQQNDASEWVRNNKEKLLKDWNKIAISAIAPMTKSRLKM